VRWQHVIPSVARDRCGRVVAFLLPHRSLATVGMTCVLLFWASVAAADRVALVSFQRVPIPSDVPANLVSAIVQDKTGLLWFGTQGGLVSYDGYDFRVFKSDPANPKSLAGDYVRTMLVASDGTLWIGSFSGGLSIFDPATETFTRMRHDANDPGSLAYDRVEGIVETRDGSMWVATTAGLDRIDRRTHRIEHFRHDANEARSLADDRVRGLLADRRGRLWVGTRDGLQRWLGADRGFERIGFKGEYVTKLFEDSGGRVWVGTEEEGAAVVDPDTDAVHSLLPQPIDPQGLSHFWVYGFAEALPGEVWVATFGAGIDVVDAQTLKVIDRLAPDPMLDNTLPDNRIGALLRDRDGVMWVGTWGEGIARHDPHSRAFRALRYTPNNPDGLAHRAAVRSLEMSDGTIWVGTNGNGIDIFDSNLRRISAHRANPADPGALSDGGITCLAQSGDGTIWVATLNSLLHRLRPGSPRFDRIPAARLPGGPIRSIAFTSDGMLWAGAAEGMARIDPRTLDTRIYKQWPGAAKSSPAIESIVAANDGTLWVGTDNGLYRFDPRTETATRIAHDPARTDSLPENWVPDLLLARDGRLWVATAGGAAILTQWDEQTAHFARVTSSSAQALIEDATGAVWIGPRVRVDPHTLARREFGAGDGVAYRTFFIASRARTHDGRLLFGSPEGLLIVDPALIADERADIPIIATALRVEGHARPGASLLRSLTLNQHERTFTLDVAALDLTAAARHQYRYRLDDLENDWTLAAPSQRSVTYSRIPPGNYTLRVGVDTRDGRWSTRELRLPVMVIPAFYQTTVFRALAALAIVALIYLLYRFRIRRLRARQAALELLVAERTRELSVAYARIEQASLTDPLTQLRNRRYLEQTIDADLELAKRSGDNLVVLLADLDHFKTVNDTYGHLAGDAVLIDLARLLRQSVRASDVVLRWGGEEFLILLRFVSREVGPELAEKIRSTVAAHEFRLPDGTTIGRTLSIGIAVWPAGDLSFDRVVDQADAALYEAKRSGRNRWVAAGLND
jgi:diguanylate cyclase (GGDEF)-like protein